MTMILRNKATGSRIIGTRELIPGMCQLSNPRMENSKLVFDQNQGTDVWWDDQRTDDDGAGGRVFIDEDGEAVSEECVELVRRTW